MKSKKRALLILILGGILFGLCTGFVHAGALYIYEMGNSTDTGFAGAGLAARANDAGTVFTNPAGMMRFQESKALVGATPLFIYASTDTDADTTASGPDSGVEFFLSGGSFAYIRPVTEKLSVGISAQNYFGLALEWEDNDWVGRYQATSVAVLAPQLQPTVAYKVNNWLSIGAGAGLTMGYLHDEGKVKNIDPNLGDGKLKYDATDFAVQGNFGIMIEPSDSTRIGLRYLTETELNFSDNAYFSGLGPAIADLTKSGNKLGLDMKMPQSIMVGLFHQINNEWAFLGSVGWDDFSRFSRVGVKVDNTGVNEDEDEGFDDVWHFGVGAQYQYTSKLMLTGGFSYDTSMSDGDHRSIKVPLGAMYRYGIGFKYQKSNDLVLGGGLSFMWQGDLEFKPAGDPASGGQVSGQYDNVNITFMSFYVEW